MVFNNTAKGEDLPTFKIGAIPDQDNVELEKGNNAVAAYLRDYLGFEVEFVPTDDYTSISRIRKL